MDRPTAGRHIEALDGVRGLAILLVLIDHLFWSNDQPVGGRILHFVAQARAAGWVGVDLFFVLSGFLITGILYDTLQTPHFFRNFYARRVLRIFPLYYGFLFALTIVLHLRHESWTPKFYQLLTYTDNLPLRSFGPFTYAAWFNINHFWSLAVEEQFYLFWPFLVFLLRTKRAIVMAAAGGIVFSLALRVYLLSTSIPAVNPYVLYIWTPARLDGLLAGAALAMLVRSRFHRMVLRAAVPLLVGGIAVVAAIWWKNSGFNWERPLWVAVWGETLLALLFSALIGLALKSGSMWQSAFSPSWLRFFGRYSYGLYVYHYTLCALFLERLRVTLQHTVHSSALALLFAGLGVGGLSVLVAWLSFHLYERHFLSLKRYFKTESGRPKMRTVAADLHVCSN